MESCIAVQTQSAPVVVPAVIVQPLEQPKTIQEPAQPRIDRVGSFVFSGTQFKELFGALNAISSEVRMHIDSGSLSARMVDNANVAMVELQYAHSAFESFKVNKPITLGIDVPAVYGLRTMLKKDSLVSFEIDERTTPGDKDKEDMKELFYSVSIEGCNTRFTGIDVNTIRRDPNSPAINLDTVVELIAGDLIQGIKDIKKITDKVTFTFDHGVFTMIGEGDTTKMTKEISLYKCAPITMSTARSLYSLEYLIDITKTMNKKDVISFQFKTEHPLRIKKDDSYREITFLLAPRIEAD